MPRLCSSLLLSLLIGWAEVAFTVNAKAATVSLGAFAFESSKFGDTLVESDAGTYRAGAWLNVVNADPGNPGALTGAHFDTGIANIGLGLVGGAVIYTIGYDGGIANGAGADLGVIVARFSTDDFSISFDDTATFFHVAGGTAVNSGVNRKYFFKGCPPSPDCGDGSFDATLFVHMIDLSDYGIANGASISSVSITSDRQLDLIRVAGVIPEPATGLLVIAGLLGLAGWRRGHA